MLPGALSARTPSRAVQKDLASGVAALAQLLRVMEIEERFDVHVPDELSPGSPTVAALVDGVLRLLAEAQLR